MNYFFRIFSQYLSSTKFKFDATNLIFFILMLRVISTFQNKNKVWLLWSELMREFDRF